MVVTQRDFQTTPTTTVPLWHCESDLPVEVRLAYPIPDVLHATVRGERGDSMMRTSQSSYDWNH